MLCSFSAGFPGNHHQPTIFCGCVPRAGSGNSEPGLLPLYHLRLFSAQNTRAHSSCTTTSWDTDILINGFYFLFCLFGATTSISSGTTFRHISRKGFFCTTMSIGHGRHMISGRRYPPTGQQSYEDDGIFLFECGVGGRLWARPRSSTGRNGFRTEQVGLSLRTSGTRIPGP